MTMTVRGGGQITIKGSRLAGTRKKELGLRRLRTDIKLDESIDRISTIWAAKSSVSPR